MRQVLSPQNYQATIPFKGEEEITREKDDLLEIILQELRHVQRRLLPPRHKSPKRSNYFKISKHKNVILESIRRKEAHNKSSF